MKLTTGRVLAALTLVALAAGSWWLYENMEWKEMRVPAMPRGEARRNDLLAAQRLVAALGGQSEGRYAFALPAGPARDAVLVFPTQRRVLTPPQREALLKWVAEGGHLVAVTYTVRGDDNAPDTMLDAVGIYQSVNKPRRAPAAKDAARNSANEDANEGAQDRANDAPKDDEEDDDEDAAKAASELRARLPGSKDVCPAQQISRPAEAAAAAKPAPPETPAATAALASANGPEAAPGASLQPVAPAAPAAAHYLDVCFNPIYRLHSARPHLWQAGDAGGVHALAVAHGKGRVTVLTDYDFMKNRRLGDADHADFLLEAIAFHPGMRVAFIPREDTPGIMRLTWQYGWPALLALAAWLVFSIWRAGTRLGPVLAKPEGVRRSIGEHIRAGGEFLWRHDQALALWQASVAGARRRMERVLPQVVTQPLPVQLQLLSEKTGLGLGRLQQAFDPKPSPGADEFARAIATLEYVRKHL